MLELVELEMRELLNSYNFEGEDQRKQDGNYNGTFLQYFEHMTRVRRDMETFFRFG